MTTTRSNPPRSPGTHKTVTKKNDGNKNKNKGNKTATKNKPTKLGPAAKAELADLRQLQTDEYGAPGDQALLQKYARRVATGKITDAQARRRVSAGKATRDPQALRAGRAVQADINPQISKAKDYEAGLGVLYANLANNQGAATQATIARDAGSRLAIGGTYDQLASGIASQYKAGRDSAAAEAQRLGIDMPTNVVDAQQQQRMTDLAASGKANALSMSDLSSQGSEALMRMLSANSASTGTNLQAASAQERSRLEASKPSKVYSLWQQYEDQARADAAETAQQKFLNRITRAKFGAQQDLTRAQAINQLSGARKNIVDSRRPSNKRVKRIR